MKDYTISEQAMSEVHDAVQNLNAVLAKHDLKLGCNFECGQDHQMFVLKTDLDIVNESEKTEAAENADMKYVDLNPWGVWLTENTKLVEFDY